MGVQRRTVSHFKGLFKTFKMRYSTFLYSYWIGLHVHFKKAILHLKRATVRGLMYVYLCMTLFKKCLTLSIHDLCISRWKNLIFSEGQPRKIEFLIFLPSSILLEELKKLKCQAKNILHKLLFFLFLLIQLKIILYSRYWISLYTKETNSRDNSYFWTLLDMVSNFRSYHWNWTIKRNYITCPLLQRHDKKKWVVNFQFNLRHL